MTGSTSGGEPLVARKGPTLSPGVNIDEGVRRVRSFIARVRRLMASEDGPTAVEYALLLALILVACMHIVSLLGTNVSKTFGTLNSSVGS